ncbi:hypothetical protein DFS33DRAFT_1386743 [Desarmillaria ectypa]|nr:hypothetical protein DFS33DRAFT_1386743 [Desarmillaria ectypa]
MKNWGQQPEGWKDGLDVLLVFAGLFSAVVTTFVAQTSQSLQLNYTQVTASLLYELISVQRAAANDALVDDIPRSGLTPFSDFPPATSDSWVNGLWFTSLSLSLAAALTAVLMKQWIHLYMAVPSGTPRDRCRVRQFRYMGLQEWHVPFIIGLLPVLMSTSLGIFLAGLIIFLDTQSLTFFPFSIHHALTKLHSPNMFFSLYTHIIHNDLLNWLILPIFKPQISEQHRVRTLRDAEQDVVRRSAESTDVYALSWLSSMSSNPSVQSIIAQSIGALPLKSVDLLKQHMKGVSLVCVEVINNCVGTRTVLELTQQAKVERLIRTHLRVLRRDDKTWLYISTALDLGYIQPDLFAGIVASTPFWIRGYEAREVIRRSLSGSPAERQSRLQPIVWINLLRSSLSAGGVGLSRSFLDTLPNYYWRQDWICPAPVFAVHGEAPPFICDSVDHNDALTFPEAVRSYIYPYVAESIISYHPPVEVPRDSNYILPEDRRLNFLLAMITPSFSSRASIQAALMNKMMEYIEINLNVDMLPLGSLPSSGLDSNRHAALEALYSLILSDVFGNASVLGWAWTAQRATHDEWCTLAVTAKFIHVVFGIGSTDDWSSSDQYHDLRTVSEIMGYLFKFSPTANEAYSIFVKMCYFDVVERSSQLSLPSENVHGFIAGLDSSLLDPHIRQEALDYLHEPRSLIIACTALFQGSDESTLRQLALIRPNDPAWPVCLQHFDSVVAIPQPDCLSAISRIVSPAFIAGEPSPTHGTLPETRMPHRDNSLPQSLSHGDTSGNILNRIITFTGQWRRKDKLLGDTVSSSLNGNV